MDEFSRTLLPVAAESGLSLTTVSRHTPVLRRRVTESDAVLVAAPAIRADRPWQGDLVLMITDSRVVATRETRVLRRVRPLVDAPIPTLVNVTWRADPPAALMELSFTVTDSRHRFLIQAPDRHHVWRLDALFGRIFLQPLQMAF